LILLAFSHNKNLVFQQGFFCIFMCIFYIKKYEKIKYRLTLDFTGLIKVLQVVIYEKKLFLKTIDFTGLTRIFQIIIFVLR